MGNGEADGEQLGPGASHSIRLRCSVRFMGRIWLPLDFGSSCDMSVRER